MNSGVLGSPSHPAYLCTLSIVSLACLIMKSPAWWKESPYESETLETTAIGATHACHEVQLQFRGPDKCKILQHHGPLHAILVAFHLLWAHKLDLELAYCSVIHISSFTVSSSESIAVTTHAEWQLPSNIDHNSSRTSRCGFASQSCTVAAYQFIRKLDI